MSWNRKDKKPEETVQIIKDILKRNGIDTKVLSEMNFEDLWFSCRIEFTDLNGKGTNGKGITYEYALASGYAEFMERLQTKMFFKELFFQKTKEICIEQRDYKSLYDIYSKVFKEYLNRNDLYSIQAINQLITCKDKQYGELRKYYDYNDNKIVYLPERFIFSICGSNGLCSGNTKYEAFCQGICEVFERYINYKLYFDKKVILPTIDRKFYENLNSYDMIRALELKGYNVYVKDCTLNGMLPVLGVLVINHSRTKYCFRLGSDINMDICIQRCITEMFQGLDIDSTFRLQMKNLDDCDYRDFWKLRNEKNEYYKSIRNGDGKIPRYIFLDVPSTNKELKPFTIERLTNEETTLKLYDIAQKCNMHIYIKDYSYLGFDTLGIYIPGFSEIIDYDYGIVELQNTFEEIRRMISTNEVEITKMNTLLSRIASENLISPDYTLGELLGLSLKCNYHGILSWNLYLLIAWLNVLLKNSEESEAWLDKYHDIVKTNRREAGIEKIIFQAILSDVPLKELEIYLNISVTEKEKCTIFEKMHYFYSLREKGIQLSICNECENCELLSYCNYPFLSKVKKKIDSKYMDYEESYDYKDNFYQKEVL